MPKSIDPEPGENEFECANCGAYFHYELTRCPNCGISLYEPEDEPTRKPTSMPKAGIIDRIRDAYHSLFNKPYKANELFGDALDASILYNDLLQKVGGDHAAADRLIEFERERAPKSTRRELIQRAIQRWDGDNRNLSTGK